MIRVAILSLLLLVCMVGCGDGRLPVVPIEGAVTYQGLPLKQGSISFLPETGRQASGTIVDGKITGVTTWNFGDGATVGRHTVVIASFTNPERMDAPHDPLIPTRYSNPATSGIQVDVGAEMKPLAIELKKS